MRFTWRSVQLKADHAMELPNTVKMVRNMSPTFRLIG